MLTVRFILIVIVLTISINAQGNKALDFNSADSEYIDLGTVNPTGNFSGGMTFECWVKWDSFNNYSRLMDFGNGSSSDNILLGNFQTDNTLFFEVWYGASGSTVQIPVDTLQTGKWYHVAFTINASGTANIYIFGQSVASGTINVPNDVARTNCYIGKSNWPDDYFDGTIDKISIWSTARSQSDIEDDMYTIYSSSETDLVAFYKLDDGSGTNATDETGNYAGTLTNGPTWINSEIDAGSTHPHKIYDAADLDNVRNYLFAYHKLMNDVDLSGTTENDEGGDGWEPIGNSTEPFKGVFDGNDNIINNIFIDKSGTDYIGFFGFVNGSTIKYLGLENADVTGNDYVGILFGRNFDSQAGVYNEIIKCYSSGSVAGNDKVGGLIGESDPSPNSSITLIDSSHSSANVSGNGAVGGLFGYINNASHGVSVSVNQCYSTGDVTGTSESIGGFMGFGKAIDIINCYSRGDVDATNASGVGGLVGYLTGPCSIINSFSAGSVAGNSNVGGLLGYDYRGTITYTDSFWDLTLGPATSLGGTGKTTAQMKNVDTFTDQATTGLTTAWDFETNPNDDAANDNIWDIDPAGIINDGYPFLSYQNGTDVALPVELTSFEGYATEEGVLLEWETATEINNFGFNVELRMENGEWEVRGFVQGHGTTNSPKHYEFTDSELPNSEIASYRLKQIDNDGTFTYSKTIEVDLTTITSVEEEEMPTVYSLSQNYPNPFNPTTTIKFGLPEQGFVNLLVYNILGQEVVNLLNKELSAGYHEVNFSMNNIASGMYIYRISVEGKFNSVKKMLMVK